MPTVFWDLQDRAFIYDEELPYFSDKDSGICHTVFSCYTFDWEYFKKGGLNNWYWLHYHHKDQRLKLRHVPKTSEFDLARYGAFEIIFKSPFTDYEGHKIAAYSRVT